MLDLWLIFALGFLGSFGHCAGMCGPLTVAFSVSQKETESRIWRQFCFHSLLNIGRITSYVLVGASIGAVGSVLLAGGQLAGIDSGLRRAMSIVIGLLLIWIGLYQIQPQWLPKLSMVHPMLQGKWHDRLSSAMTKLSGSSNWWTPSLLGMVWGLIPCGFLYIAQLKAVETGNPWKGAAIMLAFGLGTLPVMLGVGVSAAFLSRDRRSQLFRLGGWLTLTIGVLMLLRSGEMVDLTGHAALLCLMLALVARPLSRWGTFLLSYRRAFGIGAFVLSLAHVFHMLDHTLQWSLEAIAFMLPTYQMGLWAGIAGLTLMTPAALTSSDWMMKKLGASPGGSGLQNRWRQIHLLTVPALLCCVLHTVLIGSHYLGNLERHPTQILVSVGLIALTSGVLILRLIQRKR